MTDCKRKFIENVIARGIYSKKIKAMNKITGFIGTVFLGMDMASCLTLSASGQSGQFISLKLPADLSGRHKLLISRMDQAYWGMAVGIFSILFIVRLRILSHQKKM